MTSRELICAKLDTLVGYLQELKEYTQGLTLAVYKRDGLTRRAIERTIQVIVECATDINNMLIKAGGGKVPSDYFSSFIELAEMDIIPMDFALDIAPSTGLRNVLVHEYEKIDDTRVYHSIEKVFTHYVRYIRLIDAYVGCRDFHKKEYNLQDLDIN